MSILVDVLCSGAKKALTLGRMTGVPGVGEVLAVVTVGVLLVASIESHKANNKPVYRRR